MITREPFEFPDYASRLERLLLAGREGLAEVGRGVLLGVRAMRALPDLRRPAACAEFKRQLYICGIESLPVITVVALFTGMILAFQTGIELRRYNQEVYIGSAVMVSMLREMGPFITGLILGACVGSAMAAQLGTMTVNDEIAALETMSIDPVRFLVTPRLAAMMIMTPILSFYTCMIGSLGGGLIGATQLNVPWEQYKYAALEFARTKELFVGLLKALMYGVIIATVSCNEGLTTTQGAVGVGQATRRAVIISFLLVLIVGYFVTRFFY
ncbi:MAG: MlaE family ABC transporter permease [Kiritimatiellia bacterium]